MAKQNQDEGQTAKLTINDIASMAGVSKKTVSRVINRSPLLNRETRDKVEAIIRETGYVPNPQARALALGRNFLIGLVYDNPNAQMILSMQRGVLEALHGTEFELVIRPVDRGSNQVMDDIRGFVSRQRLFGVVILPPMSENDALARMLDEEGCRYVRMGSAVLDDPEHMVASNDREAVAEAVRYLIAQGHRRIGLIAGPHGFRSAKERRDGFELALAEAGISLPRSLIADGQYTFESGQSASESLFDLSPRPTAIFASNDEMAAGVLYAARQRGIAVPEELSIIGFDDTPLTTRVWPPLSTVRWPIVAMGRAAALKLIGTAIGEGSEVNEPSMFSSTLIRRASVAPPASS
ncbi:MULTISPECIES: LacI family DNA-binding transcriptional regulator [unclassified Sphingobium]|jgi:LacI family transcriptional regulator|uniref:LacI family DNA-binding transcriptional regulator n=1 Tax=unclassified Sphingobium TaxID=2611147 RepID=UPI00050512A2|nr:MULTISPECIES: LacI family DNA-binding transcriptional regulator [unclassified Sphingobium]AOF94691.1 bacterial regulatory s, lacI family protein [Sphingobium sp. RAC03]KFL48726.1 LacI-family transcriptional regulator [Sphingobium sp. ba1]OHC98605.1 MAG: LacI family transcriptional regulator [Sphingomonadales bacterium RIFCSPLOWO2_12_FULL_63_15]PBN43219.1 LacI family transcriptional regulator [Sphingobium sp. D43FB]